MVATLTVEQAVENLTRVRGQAWLHGLRPHPPYSGGGACLRDRFPEGFDRYHDLRIVNLGPAAPCAEIAVWMDAQAWHGPVGLGQHTFLNGYGLFVDERDEVLFRLRWT